ncbi:MAG: hypothetical protein H6506_02825 [Calditrichaeota bacterium]|nr:hypothetical protein [Calditrichota bacterium]MCB9391568.1 hypothetical protein [Calditrichota bacterium]
MQYIGKDIVTHGSLLHLNRDIAWKELRSRAKQGIRKAQSAGIRVVESRDLSLMAKLWYDPETLTDSLSPEQKLFLAYVGSELVGGIIVTPVTPNTLFYHYGGTNELGRQIEANAYLFWHVVCEYESSEFEYLDVGVSFRQELQHYFQKYCTKPYPILFRSPPPSSRPLIQLEPFDGSDLDSPEEQVIAINTALFEFFEAEFTFMPSWLFALQSALRAAGIPKGAIVGVWSSVAEPSYVELLSNLLGDQWRFSARPEECDARIACHRWGYWCAETESLAMLGEPLIEDCRDVLLHDDLPMRPGSLGRYSVFDFARFLPLPFGAALVGEHFPDKQIWDLFHCLDVSKRNRVREGLQIHWRKREQNLLARRANHAKLGELFALTGMHDSVPGQCAPACYVLHSSDPYSVKAIHQRLAEFGVSTELDEAASLLALPCHAKLGTGQIEYIFAAIRGMINPCYTYVRPDPESNS